LYEKIVNTLVINNKHRVAHEISSPHWSNGSKQSSRLQQTYTFSEVANRFCALWYLNSM